MPDKSARGRISAILLKNRIVNEDELAKAEEEADSKGIRLEKYLVENRLVRSEQMTLALAEYLKMPPITLAHFSPNPQLLDMIPRETMSKRMAIPIARVGGTLTVALGDPFDLVALDELSTITNLDIIPVAAPETEIGTALGRLAAESSQGLDMEELMRDSESDIEVVEEEGGEELSIDEMLESAEGAPVIRMVNMMLVEALRTGASDIHIEPMEKQVRLRYRIDGRLIERPGPPKNLQAAVISRVKIMADLDIAERRVPQDGRFNIKALGREIDLRVSILPASYGEKVVMRILDKTSLAPSLAALGLDKHAENAMQHAISQPHGIILVTGPTGSGKTTTLYSCLQDLNRPEVNIITCEDPVEYQLKGINQVQMNNDVGLNFASALRSILRQDPDIILVGEIRDSETAEIAIKAALTGHLVLSTLHTNDAPGAVTRLIDMGIEPFMLASCLILAQAQRLYRKLCLACRKPTTIAPDILKFNNIDPAFFEGARIYRAVGCPRCLNGYKGRGALMEVLPVDDAVRDAILRGADAREVRQLGQQGGMLTLEEAGLLRVKDGLTTLEA
ncbi:MAG: Flp pilus assembly complex ATPase component TadA, partial [Lentisphaerae bacterium]|nr:Flp pilus assembly complex ATPase component TadA [Lentisphaerota bacterium]